MRVALFVVNYQADEHVLRLLDSVAAAQRFAHNVAVQAYILDNTVRSPTEKDTWAERLRGASVDVVLEGTGENVGYFGHLGLAQSRLTADVDAVIYCNPDVLLDRRFLEGLAAVSERAVVAPAVVSIADGFDQNPKHETRVSAEKLRRLRAIYGSGLLFAALLAAGRVKELTVARRRDGSRMSSTPRQIYASHGSVFVFTDVTFFERLPAYPCFLFGEELFVAEEARRAGVPVLYRPELRVDDVRHASVSSLPRRRMRLLLKESVSHILNTYHGDGMGTR